MEKLRSKRRIFFRLPNPSTIASAMNLRFARFIIGHLIKGLFSIEDDYKMIVSTNFEESGNEAFLLRSLQSKEIHLPKEKPFRPSLTMIRWHRQNAFNL